MMSYPIVLDKQMEISIQYHIFNTMKERYIHKDIALCRQDGTIDIPSIRQALVRSLVHDWFVPEIVARQYAEHELAHALADTGPGRIGAYVKYAGETDMEGTLLSVCYSWDGVRTNNEIVRIAEAPGSGMSPQDILVAHEAKKRMALYKEE
jgi:hypothetical protein